MENNTLSGNAPVYTPELVTRLLEEAGETELALRGRIGPVAIRSCMPDTLRDADDHFNPRRSAEMAHERRRWDPPTPAQIAHLDEVLFRWMPLLGGDSWHHWQRRRLVGLRSLIWPDSDRDDAHVWSWRRLCDEREPKAPMPGIDPGTVKARHGRAVDLLAGKLRALPPPCAATLRRIGELMRARS
jgi:hypothetical protein